MAQKSASKFKVADRKETLPPIENVFEVQRKGMLATIDIQIKQDSRFDTLLAIRDSYRRFYADDVVSLDEAMAMAKDVKETHEAIKEIMENMTLEQMTAKEFVNPCDALVDFEDPKSWDKVLKQSIIFAAVQPYGQGFDDLHGRMMDEVSKREQ